MIDSEKESKASLRISSETITVNEITQILGEQPLRSYSKGDLISTRSPIVRFREEYLWFIESGLSPTDSIDNHLEKIADFIELHITGLQELNSKGCDIGIYCCFTSFGGQGGIVLTGKILKKLTMLPIDLVVDMYLIDAS